MTYRIADFAQHFPEAGKKHTKPFVTSINNYAIVCKQFFRISTMSIDILGTFTIPANTDWKVYETTIKKTSGIHALWMEYKGADSDENELFRIDWFTFE